VSVIGFYELYGFIVVPWVGSSRQQLLTTLRTSAYGGMAELLDAEETFAQDKKQIGPPESGWSRCTAR
jgi:hypothetical protein